MTKKTIPALNKLNALRAEMKRQNIHAYLVPRADEYMGEFVAPYAERLQYISAFTGSAGLAIITEDKAFALSDARYTLQIAAQVDSTCFETGDYITTPPYQWIMNNMEKGSIVGYDPHLHTAAQIKTWTEELAKQAITLTSIEENLIDVIWQDQPPKPKGQVTLFSEKIAGQTTAQKIQMLQNATGLTDAHIVITRPDSIAWLLNIRGSDTEYIPQALSTMILNMGDHTIQWYIDPVKISDEVIDHHENTVQILSPKTLRSTLKSLTGQIYLDFKRAPIWFKSILEQSRATLTHLTDPCLVPKSIKTEPEKEAIRQTHIVDGVALVRFLHWLEIETKTGTSLTEYQVAIKLEEFRAQHPAFQGNSFPTICGFGANGAIVHYRATEKNHAPIGRDSLLLIDSGGQYSAEGFAGTTDITRTLAIGTPTEAMKTHFTLVLKGHIALSMAKFPQGTTGAQADIFARKPLWDHNLDFAHGTGHGVGCYLAVHEEAPGISPRVTDAILPNMLLSNEPGYYEENAYGIRIENLILAKEITPNAMTGLPMIAFETVSYAPIDKAVIKSSLLSAEEKTWLNSYHAQTYEKLSPYLSSEDKAWLLEKTKPIC